MSDTHDCKFIIEARSKNLLKGAIILGGVLEDTLAAYMKWADESKLEQKGILYADLYLNNEESDDFPEHVDTLQLKPDHSLEITPVTEKTRREFMALRGGIIGWLQELIAGILSHSIGDYKVIEVEA